MNKNDSPIIDITEEDYNRLQALERKALRDRFAGLAMQGCIAKGAPLVFQDIANKAYDMADAMLEARSK